MGMADDWKICAPGLSFYLSPPEIYREILLQKRKKITFIQSPLWTYSSLGSAGCFSCLVYRLSTPGHALGKRESAT